MAYDSTNTGAEVDAAVAKVQARSGDLVDGSGNANKVTKFFGTNTVTDSIITDSGSAVTVAGALEASGDLTVDTTTLKVDSTNNRVGIGTASPAVPLDVNGQARVVGNLLVGTDDTTPNGMIKVYGGGAAQNEGGEIQLLTAADHDGTYDYYRLDAFEDYLRIGREGETDITLNSDGNVGIGDNDPSKELVVKNTATAGSESIVNIISGNAGVAGIYLGDSDDDIVGGIVYDNSADTLQLRSSNNQTAVTINSLEQVGIGTTPSHKLDVNSGATNQVALFKSTDATALIELADDTGSVQIITPQNGGLRLATGGSSGGVGATSGLFIDETQNVGIGDDTPSYKLDVNGTGRFVGELSVDDDLEINGLVRGPSNNEGRLLLQAGDSSSHVGTGANIELYSSNHATTSIRNNAYYDAAVHVFRPQDGSASNFLITTAGDVAIGPAAPAHALDVTGTGRFSTGVTFGSDTAAANKLDDYEEGTWVPQITFGGGNTSVAYNYQVGTYTKIGDLVTASCYMSLSSKGSSTGDAVLTNLPFASRNLTANLVPAALRFSNISFADFPMGWNQTSSTDIHLQETTNAGVTTNLTDANFSNSSEVMISISYRV
jgi:hypothetical protein